MSHTTQPALHHSALRHAAAANAAVAGAAAAWSEPPPAAATTGEVVRGIAFLCLLSLRVCVCVTVLGAPVRALELGQSIVRGSRQLLCWFSVF